MTLNLIVVNSSFKNSAVLPPKRCDFISHSCEKDLRVSVDCDLSVSQQNIMTAKKAKAILGCINRRIMLQTKENSLSVVFSSQSIARILCSDQDIPI